jgi:tight adherence protein B
VLTPENAPLLIALLAAFCVVSLVIGLLYKRLAGPPLAEQRRQAITGAGASGGRAVPSQADGKRKRAVEVTLKELEDKQKSRRNARPTLITRMRQAGLSWSKKTYLVVSVAAGFGSFAVFSILFHLSLVPSIGFGIAGALLLPHAYVGAKRGSRFKKFTAEFPNSVDVIVRGVKSGLPLVDCLRIISVESQEPVRSEFRQIVEDQTIGIPLDEAVQRLAQRVPLTETNFFAIVIAIQSRTGGSLSEALGNLSKVLRERKKMKSKIKAVSSEATASAGIIGSLPFAVAGLVYLTSPNYISLLFTTSTGNLVLVVCGIWMSIGMFVMRKMINFDF